MTGPKIYIAMTKSGTPMARREGLQPQRFDAGPLQKDS